jgi:hypothetical protein
MARWDGAQAWLDLAPQSAALARSAQGAGALRMASEPRDMFANRHGLAAWTAPPADLALRLARSGADPEVKAKGYSPLFRAAAVGNLALLDACADAFKERLPELLEAGGDFNAGHEAARAGQAQALRRLGAMGLNLEGLTARGFGLLHLAIRAGSFETADALADMGAPWDPSGSSTSCACSAMASPDPAAWLSWCQRRGVDMDRRDDHGAHWAELAWERVGFELARTLWSSLGEGAPLRAPSSFFGPLERAARSSLEPAEKIQWLLARGFLPARIELTSAQGAQTPRVALSSVHELHDHARSFGATRHLTLGPAWRSEPDGALATIDHFDPDDDPFIGSRFNRKPAPPRRRPSLLAYCAARGAKASFDALLAWDRAAGHWRGVDYLCAWREALRSDAPAAILKALIPELDRWGELPWGAPETRSALERLGPAKSRQFGAPIPGSGQAAQRWLGAGAQDPFCRQHGRHQAPSHVAQAYDKDDACETEPWKFAVLAHSDAQLKAVFSSPGPWPALCALRCALSASVAGRAALALWIVKNLRARAPDAEKGSPWALNPERALALWQEQLAFEADLAEAQFGKKFFSGEPARGCVGEMLALEMCRAGQFDGAAELLGLGMPAPQQFDALAGAIATEALVRTSMGAGTRGLERLRAFCQTLCDLPDYRAILNRCAEPILARLPDPALFDCFLKAGADPGTGPDNAIVRLCRDFAGRLSPAFAERLAALGRSVEPSMSLAVASSLAAMRPHGSRDWFDFSPTAAARSRVERAAKAVDPLDWATSLNRGFCPVAAALAGSNVRLALDLANAAPVDYREQARSTWFGSWLQGRSSTLEKAFGALHRFSGSTADPQRLDEAQGALDAMGAELDELRALGALPGSNPQAEADAFAAGVADGDFGAGALRWLLERQWRPEALVDADELGHASNHALSRLFGGDPPQRVPLLCSALGGSRDAEQAIASCLAWENAGLPLTFEGRPDKSMLHLLRPEWAAAVEVALLRQAPCGPKPARPAARL